MVLSPEEPNFTPRLPDPSPEPSLSHTNDGSSSEVLLLPKFTFPILKTRSKRRPVQSFAPPVKDDVKMSEPERPWKLRSSTASSTNNSSVVCKKDERPKFSVSLTSEEIEEDIYAVTGHLPRRRPKRRPRALQKQIDVLVFPGGWLTEVTVDMYKVHDEH